MTLAIRTPTGLEAKDYYNSGTHASPVWVEIARQKGSKLPRSKEEISWKDRDSPYEKTRGGHTTLGISFTYRHVRGADDAVRDALLSSLINGTAVEIATFDAAITQVGAVGFRQYVEVTKMDRGAETGAVVTYDVEAKHTEYYESSSLIEPGDYQIAAGSSFSPVP